MFTTIDGFEIKGSGRRVWQLGVSIKDGSYLPTSGFTGNTSQFITNRNRTWYKHENCQAACDEINAGRKTIWDYSNEVSQEEAAILINSALKAGMKVDIKPSQYGKIEGDSFTVTYTEGKKSTK